MSEPAQRFGFTGAYAQLPEPEPRAPARTCDSCRAWAPALVSTDRAGALRLCYLCAHYRDLHSAEVTRYGIHGAFDRPVCRCSRSVIYRGTRPDLEQETPVLALVQAPAEDELAEEMSALIERYGRLRVARAAGATRGPMPRRA